MSDQPPSHGTPYPYAYGPPSYAAPPPFRIPDAFGWSWDMLRVHLKVLLAAMIPTVVVGLVLYAMYFWRLVPIWIDMAEPTTSSTVQLDRFQDLWATVGLLYAAALVVAIPLSLFHGNLVRMCLLIADGGTPSYRMILSTRRAGRVMVTTAVLLVAGVLGTILCLLPGIAFAAFSMFTLPLLLDRDLGTFAAIRGSFALVRAHLGLCLLTFGLLIAVAYAGTMLCFVGIAASMPLGTLILVYAYRSLQVTGRTV
ncbi:hypothetical protein [Aeromicrobium yanjiei]|uniref:DUF4013 domain-containing protein n=1 Tax=Aeromicrobium yanjiei TaxID=2662028 RepID=A0A5Q2MGL2_9ACTN|nr:hypothetical protein [Aeromicrobium yanjiei]QGG41788.1 hypothetical protein GEV26_10665 [Aeromicrobium yanjiei]